MYYAFTFADLKAGKIAFLAGDGLQSGDGERIAFKVQAADDGPNLSDSDDATPGDQAADGSVGVDRAEVAVTAGLGGPYQQGWCPHAEYTERLGGNRVDA